MKTLYIVKEKSGFSYLLKLYEDSQTKTSNEIVFLLIHDAVLTESECKKDFKVFVCKDDLKARGVSTLSDTLDYNQMLKLIADCDKVICW